MDSQPVPRPDRDPSRSKAAFHYARTGEQEPGLLESLAFSPELLDAKDSEGHCVIGVARINSNREAVNTLTNFAAQHRPSLFDHRSVAGETLLMLAMVQGPAHEQVIKLLVLHDPEQAYCKYDNKGKNVFHHCAENAGSEALETLLVSLAEAAQTTGFVLRFLQRAFEMTDISAGWTPLHYLAKADKIEMLRRLLRFCSDFRVWLDLEVRESRSPRRTPLAVANAHGSVRVGEFLLASRRATAAEFDEDA